METVFHANLAVDAYLVRDFLERAGIPAMVEGEYLQGAAGELPLDGLVRVRVAPEHAREAREVVAEWENMPSEAGTPDTDSSKVQQKKSSWAPFTFLIGGALGFFAAWFHFNTPVTSEGIDYDDDGNLDERFVYQGAKIAKLEYDRNGDGQVDLRYEYDTHGVPTHASLDEDFDRKFEGRMRLLEGQPRITEFDRNGDGFFEEITRFENGVLTSLDFVSVTTRAVVKRSFFRSGLLVSAQYDEDSDGRFERQIEYDERGDPLKSTSPAVVGAGH